MLFCFGEYLKLYPDNLASGEVSTRLENLAAVFSGIALLLFSFYMPLKISDNLRLVFSTGEAVKLFTFALNASERLILSLSCCCCVTALAVGIFTYPLLLIYLFHQDMIFHSMAFLKVNYCLIRCRFAVKVE